jgi:predicted glycoside hydrolase/deacetylase ChbG (UPF0249 family)
MAHAGGTEDAIVRALRIPSIGIGCHIVLVDGEPTLPAGELPTLADRTTGRFHATLGAFLRRALLGRIRPSEIEAEAGAQIAQLKKRGLRLTHIDTHKHTHMFPLVLRPVLRAARAAGISAVRNPFEPAWSRRATRDAPSVRRAEVSFLRSFQPAFRRIVAEEGFVTTDGAVGVLATGTLDATTVASLLRTMPKGTWELVTHPGYNDADLAAAGTRLRASRETERAAFEAVKQAGGIELISFAQLRPDIEPPT